MRSRSSLFAAVGLAAITAVLAVASMAYGWSKPADFAVSSSSGGVYKACRDGITFQLADPQAEARLFRVLLLPFPGTVVAEGAIDADPIDPPLFLPEEYGFLTTKTVRWTNGQLLQPGPAKLSIGITSPDEPDFYNQADDDAVDDCYLFPPKAKRQCKGKGWRRWAFESRKECTAYVEQQARKACLDEREAGPAEFRDKYGSGKHHRHALRNCIREST